MENFIAGVVVLETIHFKRIGFWADCYIEQMGFL